MEEKVSVSEEERKAKAQARNRAFYDSHKEEIKASVKKYQDEHSEQEKARCKKYREAHLEECRARSRRRYETHKDEAKLYAKSARAAARATVLRAYGSKCECCGENRPAFLALDRRASDGAEFRKSIGGSAYVVPWIIEHSFPSDFRLLCHNCNRGRYRNGGVCPHKTQSRPLVGDRAKVLAAYGSMCACCREKEQQFLEVDHSASDGSEHRSKIGAAHLYCWVISRGFPKEGLRLLCSNCNEGRHVNGGTCPHAVGVI